MLETFNITPRELTCVVIVMCGRLVIKFHHDIGGEVSMKSRSDLYGNLRDFEVKEPL